MSKKQEDYWKDIVLSVVGGLLFAVSPAVGQVTEPAGEPAVRIDNRGPGSLNSGPGSMHSGSGHDGNSGRRGGDDVRVAQAGDVRQEDRREDRQQNRQEDRRSNSGGEVRGLDRADQVAGDHGQQGRDNARVAQAERSTRPERVERSQRPERQERPQRAERPERPGRN